MSLDDVAHAGALSETRAGESTFASSSGARASQLGFTGAAPPAGFVLFMMGGGSEPGGSRTDRQPLWRARSA